MATAVQNTELSRVTRGLGRAASGLFGARRKIATGAAALLASAMGYHVVFGHNGLIAYRAKRQEVKELQMQMNALQSENGHLRSHVDRLSSDPNAIEHEAREALHYARPGEVIYTMPQDHNEAR